MGVVYPLARNTCVGDREVLRLLRRARLIGRLELTEDGDEVEVVEAVTCRRCNAAAK